MQRVLVVDDQFLSARLISRALRSALPVAVREESDARRGLDAVHEGDLDLVILDLHMPGLDGFQFLERVRSGGPEDGYLPILVMTGDLEREARRRALEIGANDFITKPFDIDELILRSRNLLETRRLHVALESRSRQLARDVAAAAGTLERMTAIRAIADRLAQLRPDRTTRATAERVCDEVVAAPGVAAAAVVCFNADGTSEALAVRGPESLPIVPGEVLPSGAHRYLVSRSVTGPWLDSADEWPPPSRFGEAIARSGVRAIAYAPLRLAEVRFGVLALGFEADRSEELPEPVAVSMAAEFAALIAPLLGLPSPKGAAETERRIAAIIDAEAFAPVYQPVVDLASGTALGFEALTRFADGEPPARRFAEAHDVGLGVPLELGAIKTALRDATTLPGGTFLSVNVSPGVLVAETVAGIAAAADRPLVLELTEHEAVPDYAALREAIRRLGPGIRVAVDDAGAGYASLRHILELEPGYLKLDMGLVRGIDHDPARQALVAGMSFFAQHTGATLIAEGIETEAERSALRELGLSLGQGYLFGRPGPATHWGERWTA